MFYFYISFSKATGRNMSLWLAALAWPRSKASKMWTWPEVWGSARVRHQGLEPMGWQRHMQRKQLNIFHWPECS